VAEERALVDVELGEEDVLDVVVAGGAFVGVCERGMRGACCQACAGRRRWCCHGRRRVVRRGRGGEEPAARSLAGRVVRVLRGVRVRSRVRPSGADLPQRLSRRASKVELMKARSLSALLLLHSSAQSSQRAHASHERTAPTPSALQDPPRRARSRSQAARPGLAARRKHARRRPRTAPGRPATARTSLDIPLGSPRAARSTASPPSRSLDGRQSLNRPSSGGFYGRQGPTRAGQVQGTRAR